MKTPKIVSLSISIFLTLISSAQLASVPNKLDVAIGPTFDFKPFVAGTISYLGQNKDGYYMVARKLKDVHLLKFDYKLRMVAEKSMKELVGVKQKFMSTGDFVFEDHSILIRYTKGSKPPFDYFTQKINTESMTQSGDKQASSNPLPKGAYSKKFYSRDSADVFRFVYNGSSQKSIKSIWFQNDDSYLSLDEVNFDGQELEIIHGITFEETLVAIVQEEPSRSSDANTESTYLIYWSKEGDFIHKEKLDDDTYNIYQNKLVQADRGFKFVGVTRYSTRHFVGHQSTSFFYKDVYPNSKDNKPLKVIPYPEEAVKFIERGRYAKNKGQFESKGLKLGVGDVEYFKASSDQLGNIYLACQPLRLDQMLRINTGVILAKITNDGTIGFTNYLPHLYRTDRSGSVADISYALLTGKDNCYIVLSGEIVKDGTFENAKYFKGIVVAEGNTEGSYMKHIYSKPLNETGLVKWMPYRINNHSALFTFMESSNTHKAIRIEAK